MPASDESRPMLVGEDNPYGGDPHFALYPAPDGCAGHRLCCVILGMRRADYLREFARTNLCVGRWSMREARDRAIDELRVHRGPLILLGARVARAFEFDPWRPFTLADGGKTLLLPHPSGRCRLWNVDGAAARARAMVAGACPGIAHLLGVV